jgi:hypothetical protein
MTSQKNATQKRNADWRKAIAEHRIVRFNNGDLFKEYSTAEEANEAVQEATKNEIPANIVG